MSNIIQTELALAKEKMIEEIVYNGENLVKLTRDNIAIVEAMILNDSSYSRSVNKDAAPQFNARGNITYGGSTAYWMSKLRTVLMENSKEDCLYEKIIQGAVEAVDRENSTHLNSDGCGRMEIISRLWAFNREEFLVCLKDPTYENMKLFKEIARKTSAEKRARTNVSFASKFCHYACFYIFENTEYQDNYSIYDSVLKAVLPKYLKYYDIRKNYNLNKYSEYRLAVDEIRIASGIEISRNGLDHLLWYYHKGRM